MFLTVALLFLFITNKQSSASNNCDPNGFQRAVQSSYKEKSLNSKNEVIELEAREKLDLNSRDVNYICVNPLSSFQKLKNLTVTNASISYIQLGTFKNILTLTSVDVSHNNLTEIKIGEFDNINLSNLIVHNNLIREIGDEAFTNLPNLKVLDLQYNKLEVIAVGIFNGLRLKSLRLNNNKISFIDERAFDQMEYLESVYLSSNLLQFYNILWFKNCNNFAYMNFSSNKIGTIPSQAFVNLKDTPTLVNLHFDDNGLKFIRPRAFSNGPNLRFVTLARNNITFLPEDAFQNTTALVINLESNSLTCLPHNMTNVLVAMKMHYLDKNPWSEKCLEHIKDFAKRNGVNVHINKIFIQVKKAACLC